MMTEKEFEAAVKDEMERTASNAWSVTAVAKAVALRAGLEFAPEPEPVRLPCARYTMPTPACGTRKQLRAELAKGPK